jgi:aryl-alcohol dehydrogenase-like predicted oxidoreductase
MPLNHYVTLGRSGLRVSPISLGAMMFGEDLDAAFGTKVGSDEKESQRLMDRYLELGGNFIDTANFYMRGHSEKIIGDHLAHDREKRDRVVIATKFSGNLYPGDPNGGGANRKSIIAQAEQSLRRLRTDYIDLYYLHIFDKHTPVEETVAAMNDLVKAGKVRYLGISDAPAWKAAQMQLLAQVHGWAPFVALQIEYSLVERTVEAELIPMARELGLGVVPWSPLGGGRLSGKYTRENTGKVTGGRAAAVRVTERDYDIVEVLSRIAKELDTTIPRVALAWLSSRPGVTAPIVGGRTVSHFDDNVASLEVKLSDEQVKALDAVSAPTLPFPAAFLNGAASVFGGGTRINGETSPISPILPQKRGEHY